MQCPKCQKDMCGPVTHATKKIEHHQYVCLNRDCPITSVIVEEKIQKYFFLEMNRKNKFDWNDIIFVEGTL